jgi:hypothetical protein
VCAREPASGGSLQVSLNSCRDFRKTLKNKFLSFQNNYKCLLDKFKTFANLNCELITKIEQLESKAPFSPTDDSMIKKNEKLKTKLAPL